MKPERIAFIADVLRRTSGLIINEEKAYLVSGRLTPVARQEGFETLDEFIDSMMAKSNPAHENAVMEAMTTNETFFFRDKRPFEIFENTVLPALAETRTPGSRVRLWTAAASSGQELYSIAMIIEQARAKLNSMKFDLLGTDISKEILDKARAGIYSQFEVQRGLPIQMLVKFFEKDGDLWQISQDMRAACKFEEFNLLNDFTKLGKFDVVFCRNVLIYFDQDTKKNVLERIAKLMPDDGYMFLGAAETVIGITEAFKPVPDNRGLYQKNPDFNAAAGRSAA